MNRITMTVLDQMLAVADLDPEFVHPDARLGRDFDVSSDQIRAILTNSARLLGIDIPAFDISDASPRQLVELLGSCTSSWAGRDAA